MGSKTGIQWTDATWSPIRVRVKPDAAQICADKGYSSLFSIANVMAGHVGPHCEHVSPGCANCYAETNNHRRLPANGTGLPYDRRSRDLIEVFVDEKILQQPLRWRPVKAHSADCERYGEARDGMKMACACANRPRRIFVENQSDLFGEWVAEEMIDRVFAVMALCPQHIFQVLTKRPERMLRYFTELGSRRLEVRSAFIGRQFQRIAPERGPVYEWAGLPLPNVWLGVSVEDQAAADARIPLLLKTPAAVHFISAEPLLGRINLGSFLDVMCPVCQGDMSVPAPGGGKPCPRCFDHKDGQGRGDAIDWVIIGGESGPGARPMRLEWARSILRQCQAASVPAFMKQLGGNITDEDQQTIQGATGHSIQDAKGGNWMEWPVWLRVRGFPHG